jgi:hypothetical protein
MFGLGILTTIILILIESFYTFSHSSKYHYLVSPMATILFFASPKKRRQKKGDPISVLFFAFANFYGQFVNSLRSNTTN